MHPICVGVDIMARIAEFCASNIARLLLKVVIGVVVLLCIGVWMFYSKGCGSLVKQPAPASAPAVR